MSSGIIRRRHHFPVIELAPLPAELPQAVEDMIAGLPHNHPDITSEHFPDRQQGGGEVVLFLAKPLHDREHRPTDEVLRLLDEAGFVPEGLSRLAALKEHADELWAAGVCYLAALAPDSIWRQPDGRYAVYLVLNPKDRGFHLHWLGPDPVEGGDPIPEEQRAEVNGQLWFLVRSK